jgi:hypothetical protein
MAAQRGISAGRRWHVMNAVDRVIRGQRCWPWCGCYLLRDGAVTARSVVLMTRTRSPCGVFRRLWLAS